MNRHRHRFAGIMGALLGAVVCHPLTAQLASPGNTAGSSNSHGVAGVIPFTADEVTVTTQTLANGTKITHKRLEKLYRDSQGRLRREHFRAEAESVGQGDSPQSVEINDPVAGAHYTLNPGDRTAQRREIRRPTPSGVLHSPAASGNLAPAPPVPPRPTVEDLDTQVIEGLEARGERVTTSIPAGADGNDQPMQITYERWYSEKARLTLLVITNDPRYGERVLHLSNLVLDEPPAELFQVPADYTVQELQPVAKPASSEE
jgi:hypothetical protein